MTVTLYYTITFTCADCSERATIPCLPSELDCLCDVLTEAYGERASVLVLADSECQQHLPKGWGYSVRDPEDRRADRHYCPTCWAEYQAPIEGAW